MSRKYSGSWDAIMFVWMLWIFNGISCIWKVFTKFQPALKSGVRKVGRKNLYFLKFSRKKYISLIRICQTAKIRQQSTTKTCPSWLSHVNLQLDKRKCGKSSLWRRWLDTIKFSHYPTSGVYDRARSFVASDRYEKSSFKLSLKPR